MPCGVPNTIESILARLLVEDRGYDTPCWVWPLSCDRDGYGKVKYQGKLRVLHRLIYVELVGPFPEDTEADHLCRVRSCANPAHIEPVSGYENWSRSSSPLVLFAQQLACLEGHLLSGHNLILKTRKNKSGLSTIERVCRYCKNRRDRERRARAAGRSVRALSA